MPEIFPTSLTHENEKSGAIENIYINETLRPEEIVDFTIPFYTFMLEKPEPIKVAEIKTYHLGKIEGCLDREDLYNER